MTNPQYPQGPYQQFPEHPQPSPYGPPPGGYAPPPKPPRPPMTPQQKALAIVGGSLGVFLIALLILGLTTTNSTPQTTAAPDQIVTRDSNASNEQDVKGIKQTIAGMADAAKANNFKKMLTFFCAKYREAFKDIAGSGEAPDLTSLTKTDNGPSKITGIDIDGDTAVLHITDNKGKHNIEFKKEVGNWKFCPAAK